jgi:cyclophilin family peptidyl-prolyl cis-trans isomerase
MCPSRTLKRKMRRRKNRNTILIVSVVAIAALLIAVYFIFYSNANNNNIPTGPPNSVLLRTTMGDILIQLRNDTPITTTNFKNLVQEGVYNGTIFHRVIKDMMIQGGDPTGTGYGDLNLSTIEDEITSTSNNTRGTVAMANTGQPNSASSQFYINVANNTYLDGDYAVFGDVIKGMDVADNISNVTVNSNYRPYQSITVTGAWYFG